MKHAIKARHAMLATLLAGSTLASTGCSTSAGFSLPSMNPFAKSTPAVGNQTEKNSITESIASTTTGAGKQVKAVGVSAKNAIGKTTNAMTSVFRRNRVEDSVDPTDPLRLDNKPETIDPKVFVANGQLWESTGDLTKAMESYTKALENAPNDGPALTSVARLHFRQGKLDQAANFFQRAISQNPQDAGLHNDLGLTFSKQANYPAAIASLEKALEIAPGTSRYANNLASVCYDSGNPARAMEVLTKNNKPAVAHFNMAYLHFKSGQLQQARGHVAETMKHEPQASTDAAVGRAVARSRDMLAQIDASIAPVAQAAPQAAVAGQYNGNSYQAQSIKQASQSEAAAPAVPATSPTTSQTATPTMAPATSPTTQPAAAPQAAAMAPAMKSIEPPQATKPAVPKATTPQAKPVADVPSWMKTLPTNTSTSGPKPTRPEVAKPAAVEAVTSGVEKATKAVVESTDGSVPFSLPSGFTLPQSK